MARKNTITGNAKLAIGYVRVSTDEQDLGPEAQRASIEAWAKRSGVIVVAWHEDRLCGATPIDKRPALLAAIDALAEYGAGVFVIAKRDRLARDVVAAAMIERLAERSGARVVSAAGEGTDNDDPSSMLMRRMVDAFAEYERSLIRARTKAALAVKSARGERVGTVAFGKCVAADGRTLIEHEGEVAIIARVREARGRGVTFRSIVAELEAVGIKSRAGRPFGLAQVAGMVAV
jgi:DNA invertase Pin-like site-specific DNA recombinase